MSTTPTCWNELATELKKSNTEAINKILQNCDFTATDDNGWNYLMHGGRSSSSPEVMKLVFEKIDEAGGKALLQSQFTATDDCGWNCLMHCCMSSSSLEIVKLVFEKIDEVGDPEFLANQLTATNNYNRSCLALVAFPNSTSSPEVVKFLAAVLFYADLFKQEYAKLEDYTKGKLNEKTGIDSSSWTPDAARLAEIEILLEEGNFIRAIHNSQHSKMKEILKNSESAKKILHSKFRGIMLTNETPLETMNVLISEIKRIGGGDQYLKELLSKEETPGETCLLSVCLNYPHRLELILDTIEEVGGEALLAEQISKKRQSDEMTCLYALCKFTADEYSSLSFLVGKIFQLEHGRRILSEQLTANPCLEGIFSRPLVPEDEKKKMASLFLMVNLYSITGLFEDQYSRLDDKEEKKTLRNLCNIEGDWSRVQTTDSTILGDIIGKIKKSIKNKNKNNEKN